MECLRDLQVCVFKTQVRPCNFVNELINMVVLQDTSVAPPSDLRSHSEKEDDDSSAVDGPAILAYVKLARKPGTPYFFMYCDL